MNSITSTPTSGTKVPALSSQFCEVMTSMRSESSHVDDHEHDGADGRGTEEQGAVLAHLARLHGSQGRPGAAGDRAGSVDRAIDDPLVDVAVDELAEAATEPTGRVDEAVDHV